MTLYDFLVLKAKTASKSSVVPMEDEHVEGKYSYSYVGAMILYAQQAGTMLTQEVTFESESRMVSMGDRPLFKLKRY